MTGLKTNERLGTRAVLRYCRMSAYKAREVLDLIRGLDAARAAEVLRYSERDAAHVIGKLLASAVANAENNDGMDPEELYVSACYADEGTTMKRWRPRARGRATRIRKRTCHITVIVSRLPDERLARLRAERAAEVATRRARRVAGARKAQAREEPAVDEAGAEEIVQQEAPAIEAAEQEFGEGGQAEAVASEAVAPEAGAEAPEPAEAEEPQAVDTAAPQAGVEEPAEPAAEEPGQAGEEESK